MKKKLNIASLLALGLLGSLTAEDAPKTTTGETLGSNQVDPAHGNMGYHLMTEDELLLELNGETAKLYQSLDAEGKELARKVASQRCAQSNYCAGLNACADTEHSCAGKGACKGKSKCGFNDKNLAVKVVAAKMAKKREDLTKEKTSPAKTTSDKKDITK